jgi:hypothetical protein
MRRDQLSVSGGHVSVWVAILLVLIGGYFVFTFLPPWYNSWKAKNLIGEVISGMSSEGINEYQLKQSIIDKLNHIGVDVSYSDVDVNIERDTRKIVVDAVWKANVKWPFLRKTMRIDFALRSSRNMR